MTPFNGFPTGLTKSEDVKNIVEKLKPIYSGHNLRRLGPKGDGGYLVPDDLIGITTCFSPGVCLISGFEKDCASLGMKIFMADNSVEKPIESDESFHFIKKHLGVVTNENFMTIDDWVNNSVNHSDLDMLLQIDIEGCEYEVFLGASDKLMGRFRIIVAEFHDLDQLWNKPFYNIASKAIEKILQTHTCVHIHPNNCTKPVIKGGLAIPPVMEFTFIRNDRIDNNGMMVKMHYPHPLDSDTAKEAHFPLPLCWYKV